MSDQPNDTEEVPNIETGQEQAIPTEKPDKSGLKTLPSLVVVNTGHGKGKSTAAFGTMLRALALDWPVAVVQFLKSGDWNTGEEKIARTIGVDWLAAGDGFTWDSSDLDESAALARGAWAAAKETIMNDQHRLVILDEISYAITWEWIDVADVVGTIENRPERVNVILTGRDMPQEIVDVAHTVTEMTKVKHAFDQGIVAKKGIDY